MLLGLFLTTLPALAETQFQVNLLGHTTAAVYVDGAWINNAEAVEAKVAVSPASPAEGVALKAYFYSADGKLIHTLNKPSSLNAGNGGTVPMPVTYEPGKKYSFFFGVPGAIQKGPNKWKRVIVVFGKGEQISAKIYPKDDIKKFDFPEKSMVR